MGKRITQQRRGRGTTTYRARKYAYRFSVNYPTKEGEGVVQKLIHIAGYTTPLAKIRLKKGMFFNIATNGLEEGQKVSFGTNAEVKLGNILPLSKIPLGTDVCNIETIPMLGGRLVRSSGVSASVLRKSDKEVTLLMPSKKKKVFHVDARATIGVAAGGGRTEKPWVKAGNKMHAKRAVNKMYPRTSPIKRNAVDHPFGSGRGKNTGKSGIAPRWAPPGRKVGLLRPRKTGRGGKR